MAERECRLCEKYGITCQKGGFFDFAPRVLKLDGTTHRVDIPIDECPAFTGETTPKQMATKLKERINKRVVKKALDTTDNFLG